MNHSTLQQPTALGLVRQAQALQHHLNILNSRARWLAIQLDHCDLRADLHLDQLHQTLSALPAAGAATLRQLSGLTAVTRTRTVPWDYPTRLFEALDLLGELRQLEKQDGCEHSRRWQQLVHTPIHPEYELSYAQALQASDLADGQLCGHGEAVYQRAWALQQWLRENVQTDHSDAPASVVEPLGAFLGAWGLELSLFED